MTHHSQLEFVYKCLRRADRGSVINKVRLFELYRTWCSKVGEEFNPDTWEFNKLVRIAIYPSESTSGERWSGEWRGIEYRFGRVRIPGIPTEDHRVRPRVGRPAIAKLRSGTSFEFLKSCTRIGDFDCVITRIDLRNLYIRWCEATGRKVETCRMFNTVIRGESAYQECRIGKLHKIGWRNVVCEIERPVITTTNGRKRVKKEFIAQNDPEIDAMLKEVEAEVREEERKKEEIRIRDLVDQSRVKK